MTSEIYGWHILSLGTKCYFISVFIQSNKHFTVLASLPLEQWQKFLSYQKVFIITISCPLCLRELSGSSNPTKSLPHTWMQKMFYNEREFRSWYFDVNCDKMQFKPITRRLLYLKRKYFYGCQKVSFKICHCLCVVVICSPYKGKVNFLTASDDFKSMMQTIKDSRLPSTTQQINSESLVHLSHLRTNKSPKFSKKANVIDLIS